MLSAGNGFLFVNYHWMHLISNRVLKLGVLFWMEFGFQLYLAGILIIQLDGEPLFAIDGY